jgi:hypothetical protein
VPVVKSYPQASQNSASATFWVEQLGHSCPAGAWVGTSVGGGGWETDARGAESIGIPQTSQ